MLNILFLLRHNSIFVEIISRELGLYTANFHCIKLAKSGVIQINLRGRSLAAAHNGRLRLDYMVFLYTCVFELRYEKTQVQMLRGLNG
jgi:hypothetical protein